MTNITFRYSLTNEFIRQEFIESGKSLAEKNLIKIESADLSRESREFITRSEAKIHEFYLAGEFNKVLSNASEVDDYLLQCKHDLDKAITEIVEFLTSKINDYETNGFADALIDQHVAKHYWDFKEILFKVPQPSMDIVFLHERHTVPVSLLSDDLKQRYQAICDKFEATLNLKRKENLAAEQLANQIERDAATEAQAKIKLERSNWIQEHGSERLKLAIKNGYFIESLYVKERAAVEYPGWFVDIDDEITWSKASNPSIKSLRSLEEIKASEPDIADNLTIAYSSSDCEYGELMQFFGSENKIPSQIIILSGFLGEFTLLKPIYED